jgi:hypothetical protein
MTMKYSTTLKTAQMDQITTAVGNAGKLRIYDGTRPAFGGTATNLLAEFTLGTPFAPGASAGVLSPTLPSAVTASAAGTATWYRVVKSDGTTVVIDGDASAGAGDMQLNTTTIGSGVQVSVTSWTITSGM